MNARQPKARHPQEARNEGPTVPSPQERRPLKSLAELVHLAHATGRLNDNDEFRHVIFIR